MLDSTRDSTTVVRAITTSELSAVGMSTRDIRDSVRDGSLERIRIGWFAYPETPPEIREAVRIGGAVGCISGAALHGLWHPEGHPLHVCFTHEGHRLGSDQPAVDPRHGERGSPTLVEVVAHWNATPRLNTSKGLLPIVSSIAEVIRCQPADVAFAVVESALRQRRITIDQRRWIHDHIAEHLRHIVTAAGHLADSGSESLFRFRMGRLGVLMRSQVPVPGVGRVDFVIGDRLVVEIDSTAHHSGRSQRLRDLRRDAILIGLGFIPLRFDYLQILLDWETVEATVMAVIARGEHRHRL